MGIEEIAYSSEEGVRVITGRCRNIYFTKNEEKCMEYTPQEITVLAFMCFKRLDDVHRVLRNRKGDPVSESYVRQLKARVIKKMRKRKIAFTQLCGN